MSFTSLPLLAQLPPTVEVPAQLLTPTASGVTQRNVLISLVVLVLIFLARRAILGFVSRHVESQPLRYRWSKATAYGGFLVGGLILLQVWFTAIQSLGTFLGLLSAGLAIALKDLVADLAGWFFILWRRPFELGDRIEVAGLKGDVVDRTIFQITIMEVGNWIDADQSTGRLIHIPNSLVFTQPLANYIAGFPYLWNELKVGVTFESDWRKAKAFSSTSPGTWRWTSRRTRAPRGAATTIASSSATASSRPSSTRRSPMPVSC
jgi:small-conductance mechanosensitive channel